jgi:excisionase family DNA binding protein
VNPSEPTKPPVPAPSPRPRPSPRPNRRLLNLAEAAELLGMSAASVRRLVWAGKLPVVRLTRRIQIDVRDLERLLEQAKDRSAW